MRSATISPRAKRRSAAEFAAADAREIVVYVVTAAYLQVLAESARVDSAKVQVDSAQAIFQQASDRFNAGLSAKIDMTRSQVELQTAAAATDRGASGVRQREDRDWRG